MIRAIQQAVRTAPVAITEIRALIVATVSGSLDTHIEADVPTLHGSHRTALKNVEMVRSGPNLKAITYFQQNHG